MSSEPADGTLYRVYRNRIGEPRTHDEVRGYWVFLVGLILGALGLLLFLPSQSAAGAPGLTLRELSIALAAIGLAMLVAGPLIRLPLQPWANYAAYLGQAVCFVAVVWFIVVFPSGWSVRTGSQPVIALYALGIGTITVAGALVPLLSGTSGGTRSRDRRTADAAELAELRRERDRLADDLAEVRQERDRLAADHEDGADDSELSALEAETEALEARLESLRASQAQFELYEDRGGEYRWRLRHRNGNVIADSGEGYTRKHNAKKGLASVRRNALGASLLEIEPDPDEDPEAALAEAPLLPEEPEQSKATFEVYEDGAGEHRWRLVHDNGNVIADSGEGYASRRGVRDAVESVKANAAAGSYLQFDPASFEVYRDNAGEWRWRFVHKNGNIIAAASEGYTRRRDAKRALDTVREHTDDERFEVYEDDAGEYRWRYRAANNEIVATGGEGYSSEAEAENAVARIQQYAPGADALDVGRAAFEVYEDEAGEWRWRLRHRNGNILADSGEGYASRTNAHDGIESVKTNAPGADVTEQ